MTVTGLRKPVNDETNEDDALNVILAVETKMISGSMSTKYIPLVVQKTEIKREL